MSEYRPRSWRRLARGAGVLCLVGGAAGTVVAETVGSGATAYRTASASDASVQSLLAVSGSISPVSRATATFEVGGTVASVAVHVGQQVTAGETLAMLDTTSLEKTVTSAASRLSASEAALTADEAAQASTLDSPSTTAHLSSPTTSSTGTGTGSGATGSVSGTTATSLAAAQQAVVSTQAMADAQAGAAAMDLAHARSVCAPSGGTAASGTGAGGTASSTRTGSTGPKGTGTGPGHTSTGPGPTGHTGSQTGQACTAALNVALDAENQLSADQKAVAQAEVDLARILAASSAPGTGSKGNGGNGTSPTSGTQSTTSGKHGTSAANQGTASTASTAAGSAARLATDESTIDTDKANLIEANQALADATLVSPIGGTVAAVSLSDGESVGSGSTSDAITVVGQGGYEATGTLTAGAAQKVKVGDTAIVSVDGETHDLTGVVTRIGPVDAGSGDTYPIVVALSHAAGLFTGSNAQIEIVVDHADDVLSVPTSAVHTDGAGHSYVLTVKHGVEMHTAVKVGVVGDVDTQIITGLHKGERVVLADVTAPVPTSSSTTGGFGPTGGGFVNGPTTFHFSPGRPGLKQVAVTG